MAQATVSVRMEEELKRDFDKICDDLGMTMTTAITMLAKKMTREKRLPFEASVEPSDYVLTKEELQRRIADVEAGRGVRVTLGELERMADLREGIAELNAGKGVRMTMEELERRINE